MRFDGDDLFDEFEDGDYLMPATIAPLPDDIFETLTLMHLEAGRITEADLADLDWDSLPVVPLEKMSDQDRAQWLAIQAYELCLEDPETAAEMALDALAHDELCMDAYVAEWFTEDIETEEALVAAGKAAIYGQQLVDGTKGFREFSDVWRYPRLRGAVRGYAALALTNWAQGNRADAIEAAEHTLKLAPNDEVGISPHLANWYLTMGQVKRAYRLLRELDCEGDAPLIYADVLVEFIRNGPASARPKLLAAAEAHSMILGYMQLADRGELVSVDTRFPSHYYIPSSYEEAHVWYNLIKEPWESVEGAFAWAMQCAEEPEFHAVIEAGVLKAAADIEDLVAELGIDDLDELLDQMDRGDDDADNPELRLL